MTAIPQSSPGSRPRQARDIARLARQLAGLALCWLGLSAQAAAQAQPAIFIDDVSGIEGTGGLTQFAVPVRLDGPAGPGGVGFMLAGGPNGTAFPDVDFVSGARAFTIPEGQTGITAYVEVIGDALDEADERFPLQLSMITNARIGDLTATATILDDDDPPLARITGNEVLDELDPGDPARTALLFIELSAPSARFVRVSWTTVPGTALPGEDYETMSDTAVFSPGQTRKSIGARIIYDLVPEPEEQFTLVMTSAENATIDPAANNGVVTIRDNDYLPKVSIDDPSVVEGDDAPVDLVYTVSLDRPGKKEVVLSYATVAGGSATFQVDYPDTRGSLVIPPGQTQATITVPVLPDVLVENDETVHVELGYPFDAEIVKARGIGTIIDNDAPLAVGPDALPGATVGAAFSTTLVATGGSAPYRFRLAGGALPAGVTLDEGGLLSGTPTDGGSFGFSVAVEDSFGNGPRTGSRNYVLVVARPDVLAAASLPAARYAAAYDAQLPLSGTAPFRVTLAGGQLPLGLQLGEDGRITGTPVLPGRFGFTASATDSSGGTGPYSDSQAYEIVVENIAPVAEDISTSVPYNAGPTTVPALTSGGIATDYIIASQPANGSASGGPGGLVYTPARGFSGTDRFQYQLANDAGTSAPATMTIIVGEPEISAIDGGPTAAVVGQPYTRSVGFGGGAAPYRNLVATGLPQGLQASLAADGLVTISGTPAAMGSFTIDVSVQDSSTGNGPFTGRATLALDVQATPVTAVSRTVTVLAGVPVEVALDEGASGGPITGAHLVSLTPAQAGSASVVERNGRWILSFTSDGDFGGQAVASFTLSSAFATSAPATITFEVAARPDPSADPQVRALLDAQVSASRRFGETQVGNFQQRLSQLHRGNSGGFSNGLVFAAQAGDDCAATVLRTNGSAIECAMGLAPRANANATSAGGNGGNTDGDWGAWIAGSLRSGRQDGQAGELDFETDGVSLGIDRRVREDLVVGLGLGWGRDDGAVGDEGSRLEGESRAMVAYASWHPGQRGFLDVALGWQQLEFDLRRHVPATGGFVSGQREGEQWFASLSAGAEYGAGSLRTTPYARLDVLRTALDGYTESGNPIWALAYGPMDIDHTVLASGLRLEGLRDLGWASLSPQLRIEYQRLLQGRGEGWLRYADLPGGTAFNAIGLESDRNRLVIGLGARLATANGWHWHLELGGELDGDGQSTTGLNLNLQKQF